MRKIISIFVIIIAIYGIFLIMPTSVEYEKKNIAAIEAQEKKISLGFVGDIMLDRYVLKSIKENGNGDFNFIFDKIKNIIGSYNLSFGNLEGPISSRGKNRGSIYSFRMKPEAATALKTAGFDVVSIANNHIGDWGEDAMSDTFSILQENNINYVGGGKNEKEAYEGIIKEIEGTKIGFLAFSEFGKGYTEAKGEHLGIAVAETERIKLAIEKLKNKSDLVIVSFHYGPEYKKEPSINQRLLAETAINAGASVIVGHHPHVLQPLEKFKSGYIAYSLGNFVFDQDFSEDTMESAVLEVIINNKKIISAKLIPIKLNKFFQPELKS